ncbi:hypothetical protein HNQ94_000002 [Salirhabdus euzebyi]|uniref:Uncharacterized protein n=1 Tax=Salirhabdus euzebyi TaxID=394506 RepID=A0A841PXT4_9BACI|nr:hypothetical protein [Salirhabdus euzebyi]MBB6451581.1 hypothetical protein [Salirhabdus euzebyi]
MPTLPEAVIVAFYALGGERNIKEFEDWIYESYGDRWKDIGTRMSDMVSVSHRGNASSKNQPKYCVLIKVSRGKYCLIEDEINKEDLKLQIY